MIAKVLEENGGYAFMMESAGIQYIVERQCDLGKVAGEGGARVLGRVRIREISSDPDCI